MVRIQLGGHQPGSPIRGYAIVDDEDKDLADRAWHLGCDGYARRNYRHGRSKVTECLHVIVLCRSLGRPKNAREVTDHINRNKLDNRRANLRAVDQMGNAQNVHPRTNGSSGVRGVTWHKQVGKWQAAVKHGGTTFYCGLFDDLHRAARAAHDKRVALGFLDSAS